MIIPSAFDPEVAFPSVDAFDQLTRSGHGHRLTRKTGNHTPGRPGERADESATPDRRLPMRASCPASDALGDVIMALDPYQHLEYLGERLVGVLKATSIGDVLR